MKTRDGLLNQEGHSDGNETELPEKEKNRTHNGMATHYSAPVCICDTWGVWVEIWLASILLPTARSVCLWGGGLETFYSLWPVLQVAEGLELGVGCNFENNCRQNLRVLFSNCHSLVYKEWQYKLLVFGAHQFTVASSGNWFFSCRSSSSSDPPWGYLPNSPESKHERRLYSLR